MSNLAVPCPYCGHHTLYRPDEPTGYADMTVEGERIACANPMCDSNHPPEKE